MMNKKKQHSHTHTQIAEMTTTHAFLSCAVCSTNQMSEFWSSPDDGRPSTNLNFWKMFHFTLHASFDGCASGCVCVCVCMCSPCRTTSRQTERTLSRLVVCTKCEWKQAKHVKRVRERIMVITLRCVCVVLSQSVRYGRVGADGMSEWILRLIVNALGAFTYVLRHLSLTSWEGQCSACFCLHASSCEQSQLHVKATASWYDGGCECVCALMTFQRSHNTISTISSLSVCFHFMFIFILFQYRTVCAHECECALRPNRMWSTQPYMQNASASTCRMRLKVAERICGMARHNTHGYANG